MAFFVGSGSYQKALEATINPSSINAGSYSVETFSVTGLGDEANMVKVTAPSLEAGVFIVDAKITDLDTLEITFYNSTAAPVNPASQTVKILVF